MAEDPPAATPTDTSALLTPRHLIRCGDFNRNIREYMANYDPLINACLSLAFRMPSAVRQIKEHNTNVYRTMNDIRRYERYISSMISNRKISSEERQQQLTKVQTAIQTASNNFKTTSDKYLEEIDKLVTKLDTTSVMQACTQIIQKATITQMTDANALMTLPTGMCNQLLSAYAKYEKTMDASYTKIGARVP